MILTTGNRNAKNHKKYIVITIAFFAVFLTACYGTPDEQTGKGREIMEAYLSERSPESYSVDTAYKDLLRTAPDTVEETCFVHGDYRIDGDRYEYWVNTDTEEIFSSDPVRTSVAARETCTGRIRGTNGELG